MKFYIRKDDLVRVYKGCDLGDSVSVPVYMYPHRSMTMELLTCETMVNFDPSEPDKECEHRKADVIIEEIDNLVLKGFCDGCQKPVVKYRGEQYRWKLRPSEVPSQQAQPAQQSEK